MTAEEIVAELKRMVPMAGGALENELTALGEKIMADEKASPAPSGPPVVRDSPYAAEVDGMLTCTMGNWEGEPTAYAYAWTRDGLPAGSGSEHPAPAAGVWACMVVASNAKGSGSSISNEVTVE